MSIKVLETLKVINFPHFDIRHEIWESCPGDRTLMKQAYTKSGDYIGDPKCARYLVNKRGIIHFLKRTKESCVVSVGYSPKEKKWFGWSHRAIFGFRPGSKCRKGSVQYVPTIHGGRGEWTAKTWDDAKQMAIDFAAGVS